MGTILRGAEVTVAMNEKLKAEVENLKMQNITPTLAIIRVGEREDDISYERGATKRCEDIGVAIKNYILPANATQNELVKTIEQINKNKDIHGVLLFRPLPKHMDDNFVRNALSPEKDMDGITDGSLAGVFASVNTGYPPCTPQACMEILDFFNINMQGKKVVVIGRSLVVGKPVAMMLLKKNATVTICHTKTADMPAICREADVLIVAAGRANVVDASYLNPNQVIIDVGINVNENRKLCGDVKFDDAKDNVRAITPVPGGVGTVTTSVLVKHVVEAAKKTQEAKIQ